jgi:hypothetical protein
MTIEEFQILKIEAENKIVDILNNLETESKLKVSSIELEQAWYEDSVISIHPRKVQGLNITIQVRL